MYVAGEGSKCMAYSQSMRQEKTVREWLMVMASRCGRQEPIGDGGRSIGSGESR